MARSPPASPTSGSGLHCVRCQYNLTGLCRNVCPECGTTFDLAELALMSRRTRFRRTLLAIFLIGVAVYAPYSWLLLIDYPWTEYRLSWIKMWLALPLLLPGSFISWNVFGIDADDGAGLLILMVLSVALTLTMALLSRRRWRTIAMVATIVLAFSCVNAWGLYHVFFM